MNIIAWIGFCQGLFAAILMFTKKNSSLPDKILSGWLVLLSVDFLSCGLNYEIFDRPLLISSFLLFNPALYLYVSALTRSEFRLKWIQLLHLFPFVFFSAYTYIIKEPFLLDAFFVNDRYYVFRLIFAAANIISWGVYNPLSLVLVHRYRIHLRNELSHIGRNENLGWVLAVAIFYVVYCILALLISLAAFWAGFNPLTPHIYNYSTLLAFIYVMSFYGLRQKAVSKRFMLKTLSAPYKNSTLTADVKTGIKDQIIRHIETEKAYLNPSLSMTVLAAALKIPKYQITEVLNTEIGSNFFQFVNHYRVEDVKEMLSDPQNKYSIEAIGYDCGFASKSSFYTVFKSLTGETPISYRNKILS